MDLKRKLIGCLLVLFSSTGLIMACGADDDACETTEDCDGDLVCTDGFCEEPAVEETGCKVPADCTVDGETCIIPDGEEVGECGVEDAEPVYFTVLVKDTSTGTSCEDTSYGYATPGSQVTYVRLENSATGDVVAYGTAVGSTIEGESDFKDVDAVLNGEAPALEEGSDYCVAVTDYTRKDNGNAVTNGAGLREDSGVALGCGGEVYITFKADDAAIALDDSHAVRVGEYDTFCDERFKQVDNYDVFLCEGDDADVSKLDCTTKLNEDAMTGLQKAVEVKLPEAPAAE